MRIALLTTAAAAMALGGCTSYGTGSDRSWRSWSSYDHNRPDPRYGRYYADRYYRDAPNYGERRLSRQDRVYRGQDGRYYCRRPDGTTGLIIGAAAGGTLGALIEPGGSQLLGALIGGAVGAAIGEQVDRGEVRCR